MNSLEELLEHKQRRIHASHRFQPGRTAMLVVDMQHAFLDPGASLEVPKGREAVPRVAALIAACRQREVPVIFTEFVYSETVPCLRGDPFGPEHLRPEDGAEVGFGRPSANCLIGPAAGQGVESAATVDQLAPRPDELVIQAHTYDKFYGTPLDLSLRSRGIDRLIITGVTTDVCVNSTVLAAANRNFRVTVASDGVATIHDEIHEACLKIWQNKFARIRTTAELTEELKGM
jgi:ureidoacrylate peracid hydrolase